MADTGAALESRIFDLLLTGGPLFGDAMAACMDGADRRAVDAALWHAVIRRPSTTLESSAKAGVVRALVERGASTSQTSDSGVTLMGAVLRTMDEGAIRALLEVGADPDSPVHSLSPRTSMLCGAAYHAWNGREDKLRVMEVLLEFGADPMHRGDDGETVLEEAVRHSGYKALGMLVARANETGRLDAATVARMRALAIHKQDPVKLRMLLCVQREALTPEAISGLVWLARMHPSLEGCMAEISEAALRLSAPSL